MQVTKTEDKNENEKIVDNKKKYYNIISRKTKNCLVNLISYLMNNKNIFEEKIKPSELEFKLETDSDLSVVNKLIYKIEIIYSSFSEKRDRVKNLKKYKSFPFEIEIKDEYYSFKGIFKSIKLNFNPCVMKGMHLDLSLFPFYTYNNELQKIEIKRNSNNTNKKYLLFIYLYKSENATINKIDEIITKLNNINNIWDYFEKIYVIFKINRFSMINKLIQNEKIKKYLNNNNDGDNKIIYLFNEYSYSGNKNNENDDDNSLINIFHNRKSFSGEEKDYFFIMDKKDKIVKLKNISEIYKEISFFIFNLKENAASLKEKEMYKKKKYEKGKEMINFLLNLKNLDYIFDIDFRISVNITINNELSEIELKKINYLNIDGVFYKKEYEYLSELFNSIKQQNCKFNVIEIPTEDISIDFADMLCHKCSKTIPEESYLYYCYICKTKYCYECVQEQLKNNGKEKYIDPKHNLLFFKTRDKNAFINVDRFKLGNNKFASNNNDENFDNKHCADCYGCQGNFLGTERYICLKCIKGFSLQNKFIDYCGKCIEKMCKNKDDMEKLERKSNGFLNKFQGNKFSMSHKISVVHKHEEHIYLMIPLQLKNSDNDEEGQLYYNY